MYKKLEQELVQQIRVFIAYALINMKDGVYQLQISEFNENFFNIL